jgi:hypothetical protein
MEGSVLAVGCRLWLGARRFWVGALAGGHWSY